MNRVTLLLAFAATALTAACGAEVVVEAEVPRDGPDGEQVMSPVAGLEVFLLPYDRDVIFDSLEAAYPEPEPEIPDSILDLQERIAQVQDEWQEAETRWQIVRDSLHRLADQLQGMSRASGQYAVLFRDFGDLEQQEQRLQRQSQQAFERFESLQGEVLEQSQEIRLRRTAWADEAFADVNTAIDARLAEAGREELVDTTNAAGVATFAPKPGRWWAHARYELPYTEIYWNVPIEVGRGDEVQVRLTPENGQTRPRI